MRALRITPAIKRVWLPLLWGESTDGLPSDLVDGLVAIRQDENSNKLARRARELAVELLELTIHDAVLDAAVLASREDCRSTTAHLLEMVEALRVELRQAMVARAQLLIRLGPPSARSAWELERRANAQDVKG